MTIKLNLLKSISLIFLSCGLASCLEGASDQSLSSAQEDFNQGQIVFYANAFQNYALQSQGTLTNSADWTDLNIAPFEIIDVAALGGDAGNAENYVQSGYCVDNAANPQKVTMVTYFEEKDANANFKAPNGGISSNSLMLELRATVPPSNLGVYNEGKVKFVEDIDYVSLPSSCEDFADIIPNGSPVMVVEMRLPQVSGADKVKTEYRANACPTGQVGHIMDAAKIAYLENGDFRAAGRVYEQGSVIPEAAWEPSANYCQDSITTVSFNDSAMTATGVDMAAVMSGVGSATHGTLGENLQEVDCRGAAAHQNEESLDSPAGTSRGNTDNPEMREFDTCSDEVALPSVAAVEVDYDRDIGVENTSQPCGGSSGVYSDTFLGYPADISYTIWNGNVEYERSFESHNVTNVSTGGGRRFTTSWTGTSMHCEREETLIVSCDNAFPAYVGADGFTKTKDNGYVYRRDNVIDGWQDASALTPNDPSNPAWVFDAAASGCEWVEEKREELTCSGWERYGGGDKIEQREYISNSLGAINIGDWVEIDGGGFCFPLVTCCSENRACDSSYWGVRSLSGPARNGGFQDMGRTCESGGAASTASPVYVWVPSGYSYSRIGGIGGTFTRVQ